MDASHLQGFLSDAARRATRNEIRELLKLISRPDIISLAGGLPAPGTFPVEQLRLACDRVLSENGPTALQYGATEGDHGLREELVKLMADDDRNDLDPESVLVTSASQQALDLCSRIFIAPGDAVLCGLPSYLGALGAFTACGARLCGVPLDDDGMRTDLLEQRLLSLRHDGLPVKFIYVVPDFQNPAGVTMSLERRRDLLAIAREFDLLVIEDSPYRALRYTGESLPALGSLDPDGRVIGLYTFSKVFCPGLRLGWVVARPAIIQQLVLAKQPVDLCTSPFTQMVAREYLRAGQLWPGVEAARSIYARKCVAMLAALEEHFDPGWGVRWTKPEGGMFVWLTLPGDLDARDLFEKALEQKVAFVIGSAFHCDGSGRNTLRLNFSYPEPEQIHAAVSRLAEALRQLLARRPVGPRPLEHEFEPAVLADGGHALAHLPLNLAVHEVLE
jgi:2-aminoadipate transaminase